MPWLKVDDHFWSHPKTSGLSDGATALWLRAGSWSAGHLTDGRVPVSMLRFFRARRRSADELVTVGLWSIDGDTFVFHAWHEYQPSKAQVEHRREATRNRVNTWRERHGNDVTNTYQPEDSNAAPDPTRPDPTQEEDKSSSRKARETRIPKDWAPTAEHVQRAKTMGVDLVDAVENFRLHAETYDRHAASWNGAFTTWLKKTKPGAPKRVDSDAWMQR